MIFQCDPRPFYHNKASISFRPKGKLMLIGGDSLEENPERWAEEAPMWAARLFVGFNVGNRPVWTVDDLVKLVRSVRERQGRVADASFLIQKGIYTSQKTGEVVEEDGAQVIILNLAGVPKNEFRKEVIELAEVIAQVFEQELVIAELQEAGISKETIGVVP